MPMNRGYMAGRFALDLEGQRGGWIFSAEGGNGTAEVVTEKMGPEHFGRKHVGVEKFEDITVTCGAGMTSYFYNWLSKTFRTDVVSAAQRPNGTIIGTDYDFYQRLHLDFFEALLTEVTFPALDASSKEPARLTFKISPEKTKYTVFTDNQKKLKLVGEPILQPTKNWNCSNFRLRIDGLDEACRRVSKIEALTIKQKVVESPMNENRIPQREPVAIEVPNLVITLPEADAGPFFKWYDSFVIDGKNTQDDEKGGSLEYLSTNLKEVFFRLNFRHLGIFKITPDKFEAGAESIRRVKVEMYCEEIEIDTDELGQMRR